MVSRIEYDEKEQECLAKDEQIQVEFSVEKSSIDHQHFFRRFYKLKSVG